MMLYSSTVSAMPARSSACRNLRRLVSVLLAGVAAAGCASTIKPLRGRGVVDSPITTKNNHLACLRQQHLPVQQVGSTGLQIGALPSGPTVVFTPTPGAAQALQIQGLRSTQGSEVIGQALLYPHQADDGELKKIETCLAKGVSG
jgi:hypothetical protein